MLLLILCCDVVATSVSNHNGHILIRYKQQWKKISRDKMDWYYGGKTKWKYEIDRSIVPNL